MMVNNMDKNTKIAATVIASVMAVGVFGFALVGIIGSNIFQDRSLDPGWTLVSNADTGDKWYVNDSTVTYEDNRYVGVWIMANLAKTEENGTRSFKAKTIFDCQTHQYRFMQFNTARGQNGHGESNGSEGATPVSNAPPGSNIDNIAEYVCKPLYSNQPSSINQQESRTDNLKQI